MPTNKRRLRQLLLRGGDAVLLLLLAACESGPSPVRDRLAPEPIAPARAPAPSPQPTAPARAPAPVVTQAAAAAPPPAPTPAQRPPPPASEDWNDTQIAWQPLETGLATAARLKKPVCLVLFTTWCPHCKNYSRVFHDERVVAKSKGFVMIRVDKDKDAAASSRYASDGEYIPRTVFLASNGKMDAEIHADRPNFKFFYPEHDPAGILAGMDQAKKKLQ